MIHRISIAAGCVFLAAGLWNKPTENGKYSYNLLTPDTDRKHCQEIAYLLANFWVRMIDGWSAAENTVSRGPPWMLVFCVMVALLSYGREGGREGGRESTGRNCSSLSGLGKMRSQMQIASDLDRLLFWNFSCIFFGSSDKQTGCENLIFSNLTRKQTTK